MAKKVNLKPRLNFKDNKRVIKALAKHLEIEEEKETHVDRHIRDIAEHLNECKTATEIQAFLQTVTKMCNNELLERFNGTPTYEMVGMFGL